MANAEQAPAMASPVRTDEQIVPRNRWVPIGNYAPRLRSASNSATVYSCRRRHRDIRLLSVHGLYMERIS
ncbi:hypothetical protein Tco_0351041, partial [Tanacetum coccineum]